MLRGRSVELYVNSIFNFIKNWQTFPSVVVPLSTVIYETSSCFSYSSALGIGSILTTLIGGLLHCIVTLTNFPSDSWCLKYIHVLLILFVWGFSLVKYLFKPFAHFLITLFSSIICYRKLWWFILCINLSGPQGIQTVGRTLFLVLGVSVRVF